MRGSKPGMFVCVCGGGGGGGVAEGVQKYKKMTYIFSIIYLCIIYESNVLMISKDNKWKLFIAITNILQIKKGYNSHNNW